MGVQTVYPTTSMGAVHREFTVDNGAPGAVQQPLSVGFLLPITRWPPASPHLPQTIPLYYSFPSSCSTRPVCLPLVHSGTLRFQGNRCVE